jgi:hypothetical protein
MSGLEIFMIVIGLVFVVLSFCFFGAFGIGKRCGKSRI